MEPVQCLAWDVAQHEGLCASWFVHSVCQVSSGETVLCLKNCPTVLAGLNAILADVILPRSFFVAADGNRGVPDRSPCNGPPWLVARRQNSGLCGGL